MGFFVFSCRTPYYNPSNNNYYNSIRIQAKLNNQSPIEYRQLAA
ncbi:IS3 family transposase [Paenibacillus ginsengarvi]